MELKNVLKKRKTIRNYDYTKQITEDQLKYILFAGMAAPVSRKDYSSIKIIVVQDKNLLKEISNPIREGQNLLYNVPTLIILATKKSEVQNIDCFNVACIAENMLLACTDLNLGSIYLTSFLNYFENNNSLLKRLEIPEGYKAISAVGIGFKTEEDEEEVYDIDGRIEVIRK